MGTMAPGVSGLRKGYELAADKETAALVVKEHTSLVKRIAHHLMGRLPPSVQVDDLIQAGMIGLLDAHTNFNASKGASFETYAGIRIRGAMLDEIRKGDWAPRSVHRNARVIAEAIRTIENKTGRDARDVDVAAFLGMSLDAYHQALKDSNNAKIFAFEDLGVTDDVITNGLACKEPEPLERLQRGKFAQVLAKGIAGLPERERMVLALYYDEDLNLREVGEVLGVSESRVSQIHAQAVIRLKSRLKDWAS